MGLISRLFEPTTIERRGVTFSNELLNSLRIGRTGAGPVTPNNAIQIPTVLACIRVLSESMASLPLNLYVRGKRGKFRAYRHSLFSILRDLPNPEMTSVELRMIMQGHLAAWGNAYAQIVRNRKGDVIELWPMRPDRVQIYRQNDGWLWYYYSDDPTIEPDVRKVDNWYRRDELMHLRGLGFDGVHGYSVITLARQALQMASNAEAFGTKFYENGARPGLVLTSPKKLSESAYERLKQSWEARHQGIENSHKVAVLEDGVDVKEFSIPARDSQYIETTQFKRSEIAAIFRVPPHMVGDLSRATFSNIEEQGLDFVRYTLSPWMQIWQQAIYRDLLRPEERKTYFAQFDTFGLTIGNTDAQQKWFVAGLQNGYLSINDVREIVGLNEIGSAGDAYLRPLNMTPIGATANDLGDDQDGTQNPTN